jgi:hypothetical protein
MAQVTGTPAVIRSPHFERLTPRVSRLGCVRFAHQRTVHRKETKNNTIKKMKMNHNQNW